MRRTPPLTVVPLPDPCCRWPSFPLPFLRTGDVAQYRLESKTNRVKLASRSSSATGPNPSAPPPLISLTEAASDLATPSRWFLGPDSALRCRSTRTHHRRPQLSVAGHLQCASARSEPLGEFAVVSSRSSACPRPAPYPTAPRAPLLGEAPPWGGGLRHLPWLPSATPFSLPL
ncbi:hypothetical protein U9M48_028503 [Paspalum notatum var. saurae]|uniref:Uncharacterized protein n=1 Tax=Paspalum notatum var. saurae TaxID=547442 RepID=A0AAQ3X121_PASNO